MIDEQNLAHFEVDVRIPLLQVIPDRVGFQVLLGENALDGGLAPRFSEGYPASFA